MSHRDGSPSPPTSFGCTMYLVLRKNHVAIKDDGEIVESSGGIPEADLSMNFILDRSDIGLIERFERLAGARLLGIFRAELRA